MARPCRIDSTLVAQAQQVVTVATDVQQLRAAQAILRPATLGATLEQTASLLGVGRATGPRWQAPFRAAPAAKLRDRKSRGGRRHALLSLSQAAAFLSGWQVQAEAGELVGLSTVRRALEQQLGRTVAPAVCDRLIRRHRWRKVAPDTRHPKSDPVRQEEWKKNAPGDAGNRFDARAGGGSQSALVVSGRGALWAQGALSPVLGSESAAPQGEQRLRTPMHVWVWRGEPAGGRTGLVSECPEEHRPHASVPPAGQRRPSRRVHSHDCGWGQFAQKQGPGRPGERALVAAAARLAGTEK